MADSIQNEKPVGTSVGVASIPASDKTCPHCQHVGPPLSGYGLAAGGIGHYNVCDECGGFFGVQQAQAEEDDHMKSTIEWVEVGDALYRALELRLVGPIVGVESREDRKLISLVGLGPYGKRAIKKQAVWALRVDGATHVLEGQTLEAAKKEAVQETLRFARRELSNAEKQINVLRMKATALAMQAKLEQP